MRETWYVLENGDVVDPDEVAPDEKGKLHHKSGVAVMMRGDVPHSYSVDPEEERKAKPAEKPAEKAHAKPAAKAPVKAKAKEMSPAKPKRPYRNREMKAR